MVKGNCLSFWLSFYFLHLFLSMLFKHYAFPFFHSNDITNLSLIALGRLERKNISLYNKHYRLLTSVVLNLH